MDETHRTTILFNKDDVEMAKLKGIEISKFLRETLHAFVMDDVTEGNLDQLRKEQAEAEKASREQLLKSKMLTEKIKNIEGQRDKIKVMNAHEVKERLEKSKKCAICGEFLQFSGPDVVLGGAKIKFGEHVGRFVCRGCFENAWTNHNEWFREKKEEVVQ